MTAGIPASAWLVDKPAGITSHDVVASVRRRLPRRTKVGHAGTLDPFATGLLIVLAGRATRLAGVLSDRPKRYVADIVLGVTSATGDPEGPLSPGGEVPSEAVVRETVMGFAGPQRQRVPAFSAVKVGGERLYRKARAGIEVDRPVRDVVIHDIAVLDWDGAAKRLSIDVEVSKGTYIRQLAEDIGERLGCGGYCAGLRRTAVGALSIHDAIAFDEVGPNTSTPLTEVLGHLPQQSLDADAAAAVGFGRDVPSGCPSGDVVLVRDGEVLALAESNGTSAHPAVVLVDPPATVQS